MDTYLSIFKKTVKLYSQIRCFVP